MEYSQDTFQKHRNNLPLRLKQLEQSILSHPISLKYLEAFISKRRITAETPLEAVLCMFIVQLCAIWEYNTNTLIAGSAQRSGAPKSRVVGDLVEMIGSAALHLWTSEMMELADSLPMQEYIFDRQSLTVPIQFWTYEQVTTVKSEYEEGQPDEFGDIHATLIFDDEMIHPDVREKQVLSGGVSMVHFATSPDGHTVFLPEHRSHGEKVSPPAVVDKLMAFLQSDYIDKRPVSPMSRQQRRRAKRKGNIEIPYVNVIKLRRATEDPKRPANTGQGKKRKLHWVQRHIRNQWYPSTQTHRPVFVDAHLRGSEELGMSDSVRYVVR